MMVRHAAIQCLCWFTVTVLYYGLGYSAGSMAGDLYYNAALLAVADIPGNLLYSALADRPRWVQPSFLDRFLTASLSQVVTQQRQETVKKLQRSKRRWDSAGGLLMMGGGVPCRWGRRYTQAALLTVAASCLLLAPLCHRALGRPLSAPLTRALSVGGKLCTAGTFNGVCADIYHDKNLGSD
jgi:hypothetical protein